CAVSIRCYVYSSILGDIGTEVTCPSGVTSCFKQDMTVLGVRIKPWTQEAMDLKNPWTSRKAMDPKKPWTQEAMDPKNHGPQEAIDSSAMSRQRLQRQQQSRQQHHHHGCRCRSPLDAELQPSNRHIVTQPSKYCCSPSFSEFEVAAVALHDVVDQRVDATPAHTARTGHRRLPFSLKQNLAGNTPFCARRPWLHGVVKPIREESNGSSTARGVAVQQKKVTWGNLVDADEPPASNSCKTRG
uniref:Secreted protein n=1 Tax=Macrostomum lignano TaxID=282301 RepID=A0A1I8F998_9PLAT